ncbi:hypothetical protein CsSME_00020097 [Camellia sinensis var. sinensis]
MASSFFAKSGHSRINASRLCYCGERSHVKTSMAFGNMGRRFYGCARYGVNATCGSFEWVDSPMCQCGKEMLPKMVAKMNQLKNELARSRRREKMFCKALFGTWAFFLYHNNVLGEASWREEKWVVIGPYSLRDEKYSEGRK